MRVRDAKSLKKSELPQSSGWSCVLELELVTHQYGGGIDAGQSDHDMRFRSSSVKGQIREWWRYLAIQRSLFDSMETLYKEEISIFGGMADKNSSATKSPLLLRIYDIQKTPHYGTSNPPPYAVIAGDEDERQKQIKKLMRPGYSFKLGIQYCKGTQMPIGVRDAIRLWLTLGGVGARTSRGFGTLKVVGTDILPFDPSLPEDKKALEEIGITSAIATKGYKNAVQAWNQAIRKLEEFRQAPDGREQKTKVPGKSYWPEADSIRTITKQYYFVKKNSGKIKSNQPANTDLLFYRAAFGLPIIFHFKDAGSHKTDEPQDTVLTPQGATRFRSPLILRTTFSGDEYYPVVYLLESRLRELMKLDLELARSGSWKTTSALSTSIVLESKKWNDWSKSGRTTPLRRFSNAVDNAASAFVKYFERT